MCERKLSLCILGVLCRAPCSVSPVGHSKDEDERDAIIRQLRAELRAERRRSQLMIDEVEQVVADQIREQVCSPAHAPYAALHMHPLTFGKCVVVAAAVLLLLPLLLLLLLLLLGFLL